MPNTSLGPRCAAEFIGTFWLVLGGCGSAVIAGRFPYEATPMKDANFFGLGFLGVALAFGLTVVTGGYSLVTCLVVEVVLTFMFMLVILGVTEVSAAAGFAPLAIGLALALIHLVSIPVTATSVNPARSTGVALFVGGEAIGQLWLFWLAPLAGAVLAGL